MDCRHILKFYHVKYSIKTSHSYHDLQLFMLCFTLFEIQFTVIKEQQNSLDLLACFLLFKHSKILLPMMNPLPADVLKFLVFWLRLPNKLKNSYLAKETCCSYCCFSLLLETAVNGVTEFMEFLSANSAI